MTPEYGDIVGEFLFAALSYIAYCFLCALDSSLFFVLLLNVSFAFSCRNRSASSLARSIARCCAMIAPACFLLANIRQMLE